MTEDGRAVASFEKREVFQRAYRVSLEAQRASKSICANLAEGFARQKRSKAEFRRFLQMALGSSDEMRVWLRYCLDLGYIGEPGWQHWRDEYQRVSRMLQGLHRKAEGRSSVLRILSSVLCER